MSVSLTEGLFFITVSDVYSFIIEHFGDFIVIIKQIKKTSKIVGMSVIMQISSLNMKEKHF